MLNGGVVVLDLLDGRLMNGVRRLMRGEWMIQRERFALSLGLLEDARQPIRGVHLEIFKIDHGKVLLYFYRL